MLDILIGLAIGAVLGITLLIYYENKL